MTNRRKRRGSNPHLQNLVAAPLRVPIMDFRPSSSQQPQWRLPRDATSPCRYRARAHKLTLEQELTIQVLAGTRSLRSLADEFGVSRETIRAVVRQVREVAG